MKRVFTFLLALVLCLGLSVPASAARRFSDVPEDYIFAQAIQDCVEKGILSGYSDGTFKPAGNVTRAQFCVMLVRAFYPGEAEGQASWASTGWYAPSAAVLNAHGAMYYGKAYWTDPAVMDYRISRSDMARFIAAVMEDKGYTVSEEVKNAAQAKINDYDAIPEKAREAVKTVYALGIITGFAGDLFAPSNTMTRGQAAVVIYRMRNVMSGAPGTLTPVQEEKKTSETTLANGKPVTEEAVLEILKELRARYPEGADFSLGYPIGNESPVRNATHPYDRAEDPTTHTNSTIGCGGWATLASDALFGQDAFEPRKTTLANARPGDVMVQVNKSGQLVHVALITERPKTANGQTTFTVTEAAQGNSDFYKVHWDVGYTKWDGSKYDYDVWTRYPA